MKSFWSSLHWRKSTSTPKFLSTAEAYFVCHIRPNFLHWVSVVRVQMYSFEFHILKVKILLDEIRGKGMTMIRSFSSCALNWPTSSFNILSLAWWLCSGRMQACWVCKLRLIGLSHSMARTNLNKSKKVLTSTTTVSKYIPKRPRIYINWNPPFQSQIYLVKTPLNVNIVKQDLLNKKRFLKILWNVVWKGGFLLIQILGFLGMYFDAVAVEVKTFLLLFIKY